MSRVFMTSSYPRTAALLAERLATLDDRVIHSSGAVLTVVEGPEDLAELQHLSQRSRPHMPPQAQIIAATSSMDPLWIVQLLRAGATGFVSTSATADELAMAIHRACGLEMALSPEQARVVLEALGERVTRREQEILTRRAAGESAVEIVEEFSIAERRPRRHMYNAATKLYRPA